MKVTYEFALTSSYYSVVFERYNAQRRLLLRPSVQFTVMWAALSFYFLWGLVRGASPQQTVGWLLFVAVVCVLANWLTRWGTVWRFARRTSSGTTIMVVLTEEGVTWRGENVETRWNWKAYPRSIRFKDGLMLQRCGIISWFPDFALIDATPEQATSLVSSKTILREVLG